MKPLKPLTEEQIKSLSILEPQLKSCVKTADFNRAKVITAKIQELLRPTGHETRLLQAKNWLYETAMEARNISYARMGFEGTIQKCSPSTRLYLEAVSLLSICYLRENNLPKARESILKSVASIGNIKSDQRREQFHKRFLERLEEESILSGLKNLSDQPLDLEEVNREAIRLITTKSEDQILVEMGQALPSKTFDLLVEIRATYQLRLPAPDIKYLPPPLSKETKAELGKRADSALKRVAWRALCTPTSDLYKAWSEGLSVVYDKKYIAAAILTAFESFSITAVMIAASAIALAIKFGAEVFCESYAPNSLMIDRKDKSDT